mmetsp:Transcript_4005/g.5910  ORF Transcript_4005/g.5910 Transcript_4005/m.5910 type:complete len:324 (+) Transcript_4005:15-986(+)
MTSHWQTMSLSTVEKSKPLSSKPTVREVGTLKTNDIKGATAGSTKHAQWSKHGRTHNYHDTFDIPGTKPKVWIKESFRNRPNHAYDNDDIEGTKCKKSLMTTKRDTNPLNPSYSLPSVELVAPDPPKFLGNRHDVSDITKGDGTKTRTQRLNETATRDHINYSDIAKQDNPYHFPKRSSSYTSTMESVKDINNEWVHKTHRVTDPLDPVYHIHCPPQVQDKSSWHIGQIKGNKPKALPKQRHDRPLFSLRTDDIERAKRRNLHKVSESFPSESERRDRRVTNKTDDINGKKSTGSTTMHGSTSRVTDPLNPDYMSQRRRHPSS